MWLKSLDSLWKMLLPSATSSKFLIQIIIFCTYTSYDVLVSQAILSIFILRDCLFVPHLCLAKISYVNVGSTFSFISGSRCLAPAERYNSTLTHSFSAY